MTEAATSPTWRATLPFKYELEASDVADSDWLRDKRIRIRPGSIRKKIPKKDDCG